VAVLLGLTEPIAGAAERFDLRDLALAAGGAAFLSFALAAAGWWAGARGLLAGALLHPAVGSAAWLVAGPALGGLPSVVLAGVGVHALAGAVALAGALVAAGDARRGAETCPAGPARAAAENLESVLVAIAFALVIRHFAVEAYKIPTESMAPTLLGEQNGQGQGDRVLVAKWPAFLGGPDRWEIWVFRPPLERTINYVKRVAGLPGETISIEEGDLYADGRVCRKPPGTREAMWFPVWPAARAEKVPLWSGEGFRREGSDGFATAGAEGPRLLSFGRPVGDHFTGLSGSHAVGDVRLRFRVEDAEPGTEFLVRIAGRAGPLEARIAADGSGVAVPGPGREPVSARASGPVEEVEVSFADLLLRVAVNGEEVVAEEREALPRAGRAPFGVSFGVGKGGARFREVRLDRDVYYTDTPGVAAFRVPEGHYFFLGDNSALSQDSRKWTATEVRERGGSGRVYWVEKESRYLGPREAAKVEFRDRDGILRSFAASEVEVVPGSVPASFVPASDLHGRAFAIFWPPRWFTKVPGGRVGTIP
jgi:signal peptidase I